MPAPARSGRRIASRLHGLEASDPAWSTATNKRRPPGDPFCGDRLSIGASRSARLFLLKQPGIRFITDSVHDGSVVPSRRDAPSSRSRRCAPRHGGTPGWSKPTVDSSATGAAARPWRLPQGRRHRPLPRRAAPARLTQRCRVRDRARRPERLPAARRARPQERKRGAHVSAPCSPTAPGPPDHQAAGRLAPRTVTSARRSRRPPPART
jgi:hypothetical protein